MTQDKKISPEDLTDDQKEYLRIVELGQEKEPILEVVKELAPHLTEFKQIDVSLGLAYLLNDLLKTHPKGDYMDRLLEDVAKVTTSLYYYKGIYIDRKVKSDNNNKGE